MFPGAAMGKMVKAAFGMTDRGRKMAGKPTLAESAKERAQPANMLDVFKRKKKPMAGADLNV